MQVQEESNQIDPDLEHMTSKQRQSGANSTCLQTINISLQVAKNYTGVRIFYNFRKAQIQKIYKP
jgi:hypothetical protein